MKSEYLLISREFAIQNKRYFAFLTLMSFLSSFFSVSMIAFVLPVLNFIEVNGDIDTAKTYWTIIASFFNTINLEMNVYTLAILNLVIVFSFQVIDYFRLIYIQNLYPLGMKYVRQNLMTKYLLDDFLNINSYSKSSLVTLYSMHASEYGNLFYRMFVLLFLIVQILLFTVVLSLINFSLLFLITSYILIIVFVTLKRGKYALKSGKEIANINDQILQRVTETINALKISKVFNYEKTLFNKSVKDSDLLLRESMNVHKNASLITFIDTFNFIFLMSTLIISYKYFQLPLSEIVIFLFLLFRLVPILKQFNFEKIEINAKLESALKIKRLVDENDYSTNFDYRDKINSLVKMNIKNVSFKYQNHNVLTDITLQFEPSKHYAIKGRSGSGKSTLADLILGLYKPSKGNIEYYDDKNKLIDISSVYKFYMSQEPFILNGTVRDNLLFGSNDDLTYTESTLNDALRKVDLESFFIQLQGLDTIIDENGANLSGGQKQRLALARLFIRHYDLIVLDEHTSAIDEVSIKIINEAIKSIRKSIIISITHDSAVMENADVIIELKNSRVNRKV
tara:strand:- start:842 stop:2539 length:1698 start_codon:yes stop_codon:yes gene_type:complete